MLVSENEIVEDLGIRSSSLAELVEWLLLFLFSRLVNLKNVKKIAQLSSDWLSAVLSHQILVFLLITNLLISRSKLLAHSF